MDFVNVCGKNKPVVLVANKADISDKKITIGDIVQLSK